MGERASTRAADCTPLEAAYSEFPLTRKADEFGQEE
jgi:hypothetical protein